MIEGGRTSGRQENNSNKNNKRAETTRMRMKEVAVMGAAGTGCWMEQRERDSRAGSDKVDGDAGMEGASLP
jgi:hypothetical protein